MPQTIIGCDLSRAWLDLFSADAGAARVTNAAEAISAWAASLPEGAMLLRESRLIRSLNAAVLERFRAKWNRLAARKPR